MIDFQTPNGRDLESARTSRLAQFRFSRGRRMTLDHRKLDRRQFVTALIASGAAAAVPAPSIDRNIPYFSPSTSLAHPPHTKVDFRYAPRNQQSTICFPDDPRKTVVGRAGDLRYRFAKSLSAGMENFGTVIEFSLAGFQEDKILRQWIESPDIPVVHTLIDRPAATFELVAFATSHGGEGRVDNVLLSIKSKSKTGRVAVVPKIHIRTCDRLELESYTVPTATVRAQGGKSLLLVAAQLNNNLGSCMLWEEEGFTLYLPHGEAAEEVSARYFVRLPQENQAAETLRDHLPDAEVLLTEAREFWRNWKPFGSADWSFPGRHGEFLTACARNIQQAREVKNDRLV